MELISRYSRVVDSYFEVRELEIKIKMKNDELSKCAGIPFSQELVELEIEKLQLQLRSKKSSLRDVVRETLVFYEVYQSYPQFHKLSEEEETKLEQEQWAAKALNMPLIFEERYGGEILKQMWGKELYEKFLETRRTQYGILPREIFEVKKLNGEHKNQLES
jgi:hypothetical protein